MPTSPSFATNGLVKNTLADRLRKEIMNGSLQPGMRIVEAKWATEFGVAQGSIREAINILAHAGFVTKASGRSARVVHFSETDVAHIYQLRGAIEGLAARLAAATQPNLNVLQATVDVMREAASEGNCDGLLDCDSLYHLELCELSRNPYVIEHARRILLPFFAFVRMRVAASGQAASAWDKDLEAHQRIIDLLREGEGEVAEQYVKKAMERFQRLHTTIGRSVSHMPADLSGKVVVLTGGADGIGRECALAYARAEATTAILDRDLERGSRHRFRCWRGLYRSSCRCVGWQSSEFRHLNCSEALWTHRRRTQQRGHCQPFETAARNHRAGMG